MSGLLITNSIHVFSPSFWTVLVSINANKIVYQTTYFKMQWSEECSYFEKKKKISNFRLQFMICGLGCCWIVFTTSFENSDLLLDPEDSGKGELARNSRNKCKKLQLRIIVIIKPMYCKKYLKFHTVLCLFITQKNTKTFLFSQIP